VAWRPENGNAGREVHPDNFRAATTGEGARPDVSIVLVKWGGQCAVHPVTEGDGGWGELGAPCSDLYLGNMFQYFHEILGPRYEVFTIFITNSEDLVRIGSHANAIRPKLRGRASGALYYLWPVEWQDTDCGSYSGYVERLAFFAAQRGIESAGVVSRFPHPAQLYEAIASKSWMAQWSVVPGFHVPATTMVSKDLVLADVTNAARTALGSLEYIRSAKAHFLPQGAQDANEVNPTKPAAKGVVKLAWSWEATDVWVFRDVKELANQLRYALTQPGCTSAHAYVQEYVEFDFEIRLYWVDVWPDSCSELVQPRGAAFNCWNHVDEQGKPRSFQKLTRATALERFAGDEDAMRAAEHEAVVISNRIMGWLRTISADPPTSFRTDFMLKYMGRGERPHVFLGELGEAGSCTLGWKEGPQVLWQSLIASFTRTVEDAQRVRAKTTMTPRNMDM
jgi:hypothetical protein